MFLNIRILNASRYLTVLLQETTDKELLSSLPLRYNHNLNTMHNLNRQKNRNLQFQIANFLQQNFLTFRKVSAIALMIEKCIFSDQYIN